MITSDPYVLSILDTDVQVDIEAEKIIVLERDSRSILVEVKTFDRPSVLHAFYEGIKRQSLF